MGNLQRQCRGISDDHLEITQPQAIYYPNDTISGTISYLKHTNACVQLTGVISYKKRKRNGLEKCQIKFFSMEFNLLPTTHKKQNFQFNITDQLPPSFNDIDTHPNITYSINLIYNKTKDQVHRSIPIRICPRTLIDQPLLLIPLYFGPVENQSSGIKLEVKVNRAVFTFDDFIHIYYELQNPSQEIINKIEISLGVYYLIESNITQEDVCTGIETIPNESSSNKLLRNKVLLNIPNKIYLPPTYKFQYGREGDLSSFNLTIEYKIQFKIHFGQMDSLWQVDVPVVLCNDKLESTENTDDVNINE